jgi:hypothetical protein
MDGAIFDQRLDSIRVPTGMVKTVNQDSLLIESFNIDSLPRISHA